MRYRFNQFASHLYLAHTPHCSTNVLLSTITRQSSIARFHSEKMHSIAYGTRFLSSRSICAAWLCCFGLLTRCCGIITSYSGLETLSLQANWQPGTGDSFYEYVLPKHVDTLVELEIMPDYEGEWCFRL
ncbi:hypothetical protein BDP27DRAFT_1317674 [Rhodocollybia butyracea]|uniref:Uncharacterized protein n=1 Tax=Rhodocollybia butyracea TaxID=206335 RepID=A0A9P5Q3A7_9AGAR|nr:hypothetical protein BDP27DRAFT_1317665 [Rhodocollybia butyracea]KAF9073918.1 hypothetical protein BDP27DRAFT_1317674 [Rhodocollybia butyracea]